MIDLLAGAKDGCAAVQRGVDGASVRMVAGRVRARRWSTPRSALSCHSNRTYRARFPDEHRVFTLVLPPVVSYGSRHMHDYGTQSR